MLPRNISSLQNLHNALANAHNDGILIKASLREFGKVEDEYAIVCAHHPYLLAFPSRQFSTCAHHEQFVLHNS